MVKCTYVKVAGGKKCGSIAVNKGEVYCKNCKVLDSNRKREATRMGKLRADPDKMKEHVARKRESYRRINQVDEKNYRKEKFPFPMPLNREGSGKESKEKKRKKANQHSMALRSGEGAAGVSSVKTTLGSQPVAMLTMAPVCTLSTTAADGHS